MASTLYKTVNGELETIVVDTKYVSQHFDSGWSGSKEPEAEIEHDVDLKMTNKEVREAAEKAGIEGHDTKRINKLIEELEAE